MYPPVDPILFQIGPLAVRWYGILIMLGIVSAATVASRYVERKGEPGENVWDMLVFVLIPALIGARLYYVFIQSPRTEQGLEYYLSNPWAIAQIWTGGIHIFGAFIFGGIAVVLFARWRKLPLLIYLDALGLGMPLGQAIGRLANFINQELYGPPTTLPWGLRIDPQHRLPPYNDMAAYPESVRFQPLFLYESIWNFAGFLLLFWISRRFEDWLLPGDLFLMYLIWYPLGRFMLEFMRTDSWFFAGTPFNTVHILSAIAIVTASVLLAVRHRRTRPAAG
ncbi:MAG: prolipoprotein diacylglyceryl transferase [Caldilineaceae bacterium]|nr:prolipoprotein diacylglyceryl transferase [Caldilineaceae bacterium]